ncbi:MAG: choice-of-anchor Q domain-containing protein, partial [Pseudonocardiaceae bacterium]
MTVRSFQRAHARRRALEQRRASSLRRKGSLVAGLALSSSALFAANAQAQALTVMSSNDDPAGTLCTSGSCTTLRDAISQANADGTSDTITFDPSVTGPIDIHVNGPLNVTTPQGLTITGPGAGNLAITGGGTVQDFHISPSSGVPAVSITGLTLTNGSSSTQGGAVDNVNANLTLTNDVVSDSTTTNGVGGGGIYSDGPLNLSGTTVTGNTASSGPGGGVRLATPHGKYFSSPVNETIVNSTISGNTSAGNGGGVDADGGSNVSASQAKITDNQATGSSAYGGGINATGATLTLTDSTVSGNSSAESAGGGRLSPTFGATISGTTFSGNTAVYGGGLVINNFSSKYSPIKVETSTISGNQATHGAGVYLGGADSPVTIDRSTLSGNTGGPGSFGGGLEIYGGIYAPVGLVDSTVSGNAANIGAGVSVGVPSTSNHIIGSGGNGSIDFDNSTIAANTAASHAGGIYLAQYQASSTAPYQSATAGLTSTVVAGNTAQGISDDLERGGSSTTGGFNGAFSLVQSPGNAPFVSKNAVITGVVPQPGPLADNGGPTETMLPSGTSPVIDQGHAPIST